jgi:hypothetical protein
MCISPEPTDLDLEAMSINPKPTDIVPETASGAAY